MNVPLKKIVACAILLITLMPVRAITLHKGLQDSIPAPWTPMRVIIEDDKTTIVCWGREYVFTEGILPSQIISEDEPLLARPLKVSIMAGGKPVTWEDSKIKIVKKGVEEIELEGKAVSMDKSVVIYSSICIAYDGLMTVSLSAKTENNVNSFSIQIPYKEERAKYYFKWMPNNKKKHSGSIPENKGILMSSEFTPYFWIGDNYRGLYWFVEDTKEWPNASSKKAIQLIKIKEDEIVQKFSLGQTKTFSFGLQATPVKELPENWRSWRLYPAYNYTIVKFWVNPGEQFSVKYHSWPKAENPEVFKERVEKYHKIGKKVINYASITWIAANSHAFKNNKSRWKEGNARMKGQGSEMVYIDPNSEGYIDTIVNAFIHYMKLYNLDGYYLDGGGLYKYKKWKDEKGNAYYPILGYRKLQKRLYVAMKKVNPEAILITHASANMDIPVLAYTDAYVTGEQFRFRRDGKFRYEAKESYLDVISLAQFRAEFMGKQWGIVPFFLPEISPKYVDQLQPTLGLAALLLVHDVQPRIYGAQSSGNKKVWDSMYKAIDMFGIVGSNFIPYYATKPPAKTKNDGVYISAYKKNKEVLLIVSNLSKDNQSVAVNINLQNIGVSEIKEIIELPSKKPISFQESDFQTNMEPLSYKLFIIK